jgi:hypothetical protein
VNWQRQRDAAAQDYRNNLEMQKLKMQPLQAFVSSRSSQSSGGQPSSNLSAILDAIRSSGGNAQQGMRNNWMTLADILGKR